MKKILLLAVLSLSFMSTAMADINNRVSRCVEKVMSAKRVNADTLKRLSTLITDIETTEPRKNLQVCKGIKKDSKNLDPLNFKQLKTIITAMLKNNELTKPVARLLTQLAYPNLKCTLYGANAQAGFFLGLGAGFYAGACTDGLKRKGWIIAPSGILNISLGAAIFFEGVDVNYVLKDDRAITPWDQIYAVPFIGKHCGEGEKCESRGTAVGLFKGMVLQGIYPIKLNLEKLDYETLIQNSLSF